MTTLKEYTTLPTVKAMYETYLNREDWRRDHLGASMIGKSCSRQIWYSFHWATAPTFDGRMYRLFERGHNEEAVFIKNLRDAGIKVLDLDPKTGKQWNFKEYGGHFAGSLDGIADRTLESSKPHLLEFKTSSAKAFAKLEKEGVQKAKPEHYAQMQVYMQAMGLERALYLAVNKDNDEIYGERIKYDEAFASSMFAKAKSIIEMPEPPARLSDDPAYYECKFCDHWNICHSDKLPDVNCRTCSHSTPELTGGWSCANYKVDIPSEHQRTGCQTHVFSPIFFKGKQVEKYENNTVYYEDGTVNGVDGVSSENLKALIDGGGASMLNDDFVMGAMREMGAKVVGVKAND